MFEFSLAEKNIILSVFVQIQSSEQMLFKFLILRKTRFPPKNVLQHQLLVPAIGSKPFDRTLKLPLKTKDVMKQKNECLFYFVSMVIWFKIN